MEPIDGIGKLLSWLARPGVEELRIPFINIYNIEEKICTNVLEEGDIYELARLFAGSSTGLFKFLKWVNYYDSFNKLLEEISPDTIVRIKGPISIFYWGNGITFYSVGKIYENSILLPLVEIKI
jgi:hypothetical protein